MILRNWLRSRAVKFERLGKKVLSVFLFTYLGCVSFVTILKMETEHVC